MHWTGVISEGHVPYKLKLSANPEHQPGGNPSTEVEKEKGGLLDCMIASSESMLHLFPLDILMP